MAIHKVKNALGGQVEAGYWKIIQFSHEGASLTSYWTLGLYKDKASADASAPVLERKNFSFEVTKSESIGDQKALGYAKIKAYAQETDDSDLVESEDA